MAGHPVVEPNHEDPRSFLVAPEYAPFADARRDAGAQARMAVLA